MYIYKYLNIFTIKFNFYDIFHSSSMLAIFSSTIILLKLQSVLGDFADEELVAIVDEIPLIDETIHACDQNNSNNWFVL